MTQEKEITQFTDDFQSFVSKVNLKETIRTKRKGFAGLRDKMVFWKLCWVSGISLASIPQSVMMWISLMPLALVNINEGMNWLNIPFNIPIAYGAAFGLVFIMVVMISGVFAYTHFGTNRRSYELSDLQNPIFAFLYLSSKKQNEEMLKELQALKKEIGSLKVDK